jgi:hypothetical protein
MKVQHDRKRSGLRRCPPQQLVVHLKRSVCNYYSLEPKRLVGMLARAGSTALEVPALLVVVRFAVNVILVCAARAEGEDRAVDEHASIRRR